jgi:hypothetical protein
LAASFMPSRMTKREFLEAVQSRAARAAVGITTVRGSPRGTLAAARAYLCRVDLRKFAVAPSKFPLILDLETGALARALPKGARKWGLARKVLNIFLRDCLYTTYLEREYGLRRAQVAFEIPLDSLTAKGLKQFAGRRKLPKWPGVKHVTPEISAEYQLAASRLASVRNIRRVHLDTLLWSLVRDRSTKG